MINVFISKGSNSASFLAGADTSLLDQCLENGFNIDYSCKRGDCGQCKASLVSGALAPFETNRPFSQENFYLLCNSVPLTEIKLEIEHHAELDNIQSIRSPCKISFLELLSADVMEVRLRLPPNQHLNFLPGQFIRLTKSFPTERIVRSYSLAAPPDASGVLRIHVRKVGSGIFSQYLFNHAKPNDLLHVEGPSGHFFLRRKIARKAPVIFLATGTGIAPIYAMLQSLRGGTDGALDGFNVYWGNCGPADAYLDRQLTTLAAELGFKYFSIYSRGVNEGSPRYVQHLMTMHHPKLDGYHVFAAGSSAMVLSARETCSQLGLQREHFFADPFTSS